MSLAGRSRSRTLTGVKGAEPPIWDRGLLPRKVVPASSARSIQSSDEYRPSGRSIALVPKSQRYRGCADPRSDLQAPLDVLSGGKVGQLLGGQTVLTRSDSFWEIGWFPYLGLLILTRPGLSDVPIDRLVLLDHGILPSSRPLGGGKVYEQVKEVFGHDSPPRDLWLVESHSISRSLGGVMDSPCTDHIHETLSSDGKGDEGRTRKIPLKFLSYPSRISK
ncbi:hypothetical protein Droror1_Dr00027841 [Drosera rotundifolia]